VGGTMDLVGMLESTARKFPEKAAVVFDETTLTYTDLLTASRRAATVLRDAGVAPGQRVRVMPYNTPGFLIAAFGIWRAGAALVPINHKRTAPEVAYLADHSGITVGVVSAELVDTAREAVPGATWLTTDDAMGGTFDTAVAEASPWDGVELSEDDIA